MSARKADSLLNDAEDKKGNLMSAAHQLPANDKPVPFLELYDDLCNQRICGQLSDATFTMYGHTVPPVCEWVDDKELDLTTVGRRQMQACITNSLTQIGERQPPASHRRLHRSVGC